MIKLLLDGEVIAIGPREFVLKRRRHLVDSGVSATRLTMKTK